MPEPGLPEDPSNPSTLQPANQRSVAGKRQLPDWLTTTRILGLMIGLPAVLMILALSNGLLAARGMLLRWLALFAVLVIVVCGWRRILYRRPRRCPKCGCAACLRRTGVEEPAEPEDEEIKAWLDEWKCGKCGYGEWLKVGLYRLMPTRRYP